MKRKTVIVAVILAAVVMVVSSKLLMASNSSGADLANFEIISKGFSASLDGLDQVFYVYATVRNNGESGNVTICVTFSQLEIYVSAQSRILYLKSGESQEVTFKFSMIESVPYGYGYGESTGMRGSVSPMRIPPSVKTGNPLPKGFSYEVWVQP